jgi:integrase
MENTARLFEYRGHWLVKRADTPCYYIYWCRPGTRRVRRKSTGTIDLDDAKRRLIEFADGRSPPPAAPAIVSTAAPAIPGSTVPLLELMTKYIERFGEDRPSYSTICGSLRQWTAFCETDDLVYVSELSLDAQDRFIKWRRRKLLERGDGASNGTINRDLALLKGALRLGWQRGILPAVPYVATLPQPPARDVIINAEQAQRLLTGDPPWYLFVFCVMLLHTLQRPKFIFELHKTWVDVPSNLINFLPPGTPQTNKRRPTIPMTPTAREVVIEAIRRSQSGYLIERNGERLYSLRKAFATHAASVGLPGLTPYVLRHTGATLLSAAGVPMQQISAMLGHTSERTTQIYAKRRPEFLAAASSTLEGLFKPPAVALSPVHSESPEHIAAQVVSYRANADSPRLHARQTARRCAPARSAVRHFRDVPGSQKPRLAAEKWMVDPTGIEPATSTMPLRQQPQPRRRRPTKAQRR